MQFYSRATKPNVHLNEDPPQHAPETQNAGRQRDYATLLARTKGEDTRHTNARLSTPSQVALYFIQ
jgi:hypothetical protein